ncbi:DNA-binding response OmpR family regulator [Paenibacillus cellulosilyticus]|uniref:DNA-binding response OmpR family regulator n=2 Tax=Paenibacillus cellulosilyticus TaxID=375489 RepID=A0A2V2YXR4_9BACL|nr:DNA-binding response OmpR family regulator [Paenibacillus cellulosilyticus]
MRTIGMIAAAMLLMLGTASSITVMLVIDMLELDAALKALLMNSLLLLDMTFLLLPVSMFCFINPSIRKWLKNGGIADVKDRANAALLAQFNETLQSQSRHIALANERLHQFAEQLIRNVNTGHSDRCKDYDADSNQMYTAAAMEELTQCQAEEAAAGVEVEPQIETKLPVNLNMVDWEYSDVQILVVDGEVHQLHTITSYLEPLRWTITTAMSDADAFSQLEQNRYDLVLLDTSLPGSAMSGYETCEHIRQKYSSAELPIIMMMPMCVPEEIMHSFKSGANDYLPKPFIGQELIARMEARLQLRKLELRSKSILSKVEVEVLRYYSSHPGSTRKAMLDRINMEREHPITEKTLANHITSILRKTAASRMNEAVAAAKRNHWI